MRRWLLAAAGFLALIALSSPWWLAGMGNFLVSSEPPEKSDAILVLAGDWNGNRILKGGELARDGYAPVVYVSGPAPVYGVSEAELAIHYAEKHGFDPKLFRVLDLPSNSTEEESHQIVPELRARGVKTLLVVTSDYHTARAGRIWRRVAEGIHIRMVAAPDVYFRASDWWKTRNGRKTAFYEWVKTITGPLGA